jgi:hypothetical protein
MLVKLQHVEIICIIYYLKKVVHGTIYAIFTEKELMQDGTKTEM